MKRHQRIIRTSSKFEKKLISKAFIDRYKVKLTDFIRARKLSFEKVFLILINFLTKSLQSELDTFFKVILNKEIPVKAVTKGTICSHISSIRCIK